MKTAKELTFCGIFIALLIGSQLLLSGISGIEIVTALFLCFCYCFGAINGLIVGTAFSLLRCLIFGFYPTVVILYLVYYNLFAVFFGLIGKKYGAKGGKLHFILIILFAMLFTAFFTLLDDIITPLFYGLSIEETSAYFYYSLTAVIPQIACAGITVGLFFYPITKVLYKFTDRNKDDKIMDGDEIYELDKSKVGR